MRKMKGITRCIASHHCKVNFLHLARHTPKGRVMMNVTDRSVARRRGLWLEKSMRGFVTGSVGTVKKGYPRRLEAASVS
jgi:hypothetical protein